MDEETTSPTPEDEASWEVTKKLYATTDAKVWAEEWCKIAIDIEDKNGFEAVIDEGWMIGWFANAFAVAEAQATRPTEKTAESPFEFALDEDGTLSLESAVFQALGYASVCWSKPPLGGFESERAKEAGEKLIEVFKSIAQS